MQERQTIAHILQLPQRMARDYYRRLPLAKVVKKHLLHGIPHHDIKPVQGLVQQIVFRAFCDCKSHRRLLLHAAASSPHFRLRVDSEPLHQIFEPLHGKGLVIAAVEFGDLPQIFKRREPHVVGDIRHLPEKLRVVRDRFPVIAHRPALRLMNSCEHAQKGALPGAVASDDPVDSSVRNLQGNSGKGFLIAESFGYFSNRNHVSSPPSVLRKILRTISTSCSSVTSECFNRSTASRSNVSALFVSPFRIFAPSGDTNLPTPGTV